MSGDLDLTRRGLLAGGALVVSFALAPRAAAQLAGGGEGGHGPKVLAPNLPGSLKNSPLLDSWIRLDASGRATVYSGKAELGQGIATALWQVAAEELDLPPEHVELVTADTARTPDEAVTAGSHSMQDSGTAIANAAANVRRMLTDAAAQQWGVAADGVTTNGKGEIVSPDGRTIGYGAIAATLSLHVEALPGQPRRDPAQYRTLGRDLPRRDIPAKLTGGAAYVQDLRLPGMLHARVVRGPSFGTTFSALDIAAASAMPGVVTVVQNGSFTALVATTEWQAIAALRKLQQSPWERTRPPIPVSDVVAVLKSRPARDNTVLDTTDASPPATRTLKARYTKPWLAHGSIGPSCAVAHFQDGALTIWSHSQGIFDVHRGVAELVGLSPERVRGIHVPGAGCYGQNGADDVAADAALTAMALPGRPIRLQWMREQEFGWEPLGTGMVAEVEASLDTNNHVTAWHYEVWSNPHNTRPTKAGGYLAGQEVAQPFPLPPPRTIPMPEGGGDRNSNPLYALPNMHVIHHFVPDMPLRVSALRSLGGYHNVFAIESMMDELARAVGADPLAFRLAHMKDERARAVMQAAAAGLGWASRAPGDGRRGCGFGFARYKNLGAYCAVAMEVDVDRDTGAVAVRRVHAAIDAGQVAAPDGIRNQTEGGIVQSLSWTMREAVNFDTARRTSFDWSGYPILGFSDAPGSLTVEIVPRPGLPFLGAGEAAQGPTAAALANAVADATGARLRDLPLAPDTVKAAIGVI